MAETKSQDARTRVVRVSKATQTQLRCLEATLALVGRDGTSPFTYETIAEMARVSRPLVKNYFPSKADLIRETARIARADYQKLTIDLMEQQTSPRSKLRVYLEQMLAYPRLARDSAQFWLVFFQFCMFDDGCRKENGEYSSMGQQRIEALLRDCINKGDEAPDVKLLASQLRGLRSQRGGVGAQRVDFTGSEGRAREHHHRQQRSSEPHDGRHQSNAGASAGP